jgi:hypothetical protein
MQWSLITCCGSRILALRLISWHELSPLHIRTVCITIDFCAGVWPGSVPILGQLSTEGPPGSCFEFMVDAETLS